MNGSQESPWLGLFQQQYGWPATTAEALSGLRQHFGPEARPKEEYEYQPIKPEEYFYWRKYLTWLRTLPPQSQPPPGKEVEDFRNFYLPRALEREKQWYDEWLQEWATRDFSSKSPKELQADWEKYKEAKWAEYETSRRAIQRAIMRQQWEQRHPTLFFMSPLWGTFEEGEREAREAAEDIARAQRRGLAEQAADIFRRATQQAKSLLSGIGTVAAEVVTLPIHPFRSPGERLRHEQVWREAFHEAATAPARAAGYLSEAITKPSLIVGDPMRVALETATLVPYAGAGVGGAVAGILRRAGMARAAKFASAALYPIDAFLPGERNIAATLVIKAPVWGIKGGLYAVSKAAEKLGYRPALLRAEAWRPPGQMVEDMQRRIREAAEEIEERIRQESTGIDDAVADRLHKDPAGGAHTITFRVVTPDGTAITDDVTYVVPISKGARVDSAALETAYSAMLEASQQGKLDIRITTRLEPPEGIQPNATTRAFVERAAALYLQKALEVGLRLNLTSAEMRAAILYAPHTKQFTPTLFARAMAIKSGRYTPEQLAKMQETALTAKRAPGWQERLAEGKYYEPGIRERIEAQLLEMTGMATVYHVLYEELRRVASTAEEAQQAAGASARRRPIDLSRLNPEARRVVVDALGEAAVPEDVVNLADIGDPAKSLVISFLKNKAWHAKLQEASGRIGAARELFRGLVAEWKEVVDPALDTLHKEAGIRPVEWLEGIREKIGGIRLTGDTLAGAIDSVANIAETVEAIVDNPKVSRLRSRLQDAVAEMPKAIGLAKGYVSKMKELVDALAAEAERAGVANFAEVVERLQAFVASARSAVDKAADLLKTDLKAPKVNVKEVRLKDLPPSLRGAIKPSIVAREAEKATTATAVPEELAAAVEQVFAKDPTIGWQRWLGHGTAGKFLDTLHNTFVRTVLFTPVLGVANKVLVLNAISAVLYLVPLAAIKYKLPGLLVQWPKTALAYLTHLRTLKTPSGYKTAMLAADPKAVLRGPWGEITREKIWRLTEAGTYAGEEIVEATGLLEKIPGVKNIAERVLTAGELAYLSGFLSDAAFKEAMFLELLRTRRVASFEEAARLVKDAFGAQSRLPLGVTQLTRTFLPFLSWTYYAYPKMADLFSSYIALAAYYRAIGEALEQGFATVSDVDLERLRRQYPPWLSSFTYMGFEPARGHRWVDMSRGGLRNLIFDAWSTFLQESSASYAEGAGRAIATQTWWGLVPLGIALSVLGGEPVNIKTGQPIYKKSDPEWYKATKILLEGTMPLFAPGEVQTLFHYLEARYGPEIFRRKFPLKRLGKMEWTDVLRGFIMKPPAVYDPTELRKRAVDIMRARMSESHRPEARSEALEWLLQQYRPDLGVRRRALLPIDYLVEPKEGQNDVQPNP